MSCRVDVLLMRAASTYEWKQVAASSIMHTYVIADQRDIVVGVNCLWFPFASSFFQPRGLLLSSLKARMLASFLRL
jgi:hypothetical protein